MNQKPCRLCNAPARPGKYATLCAPCSLARTRDGIRKDVARRRRAKPDGHRELNTSGYMLVYVDGIAKPEHRLVMERKLGRALLPGESVHHRNGKRTDNAPDNLELWVGPIRYGQRASDVKCPHCGKGYAL